MKKTVSLTVLLSVRRRIDRYRESGSIGLEEHKLYMTEAVKNHNNIITKGKYLLRTISMFRCWLSPVDNSIWAFAAPAILVIVVNFIILVSVVRVIVGIRPIQGSSMKIARVK